jgi:NitT/TauT family transport system substrate-binding protein
MGISKRILLGIGGGLALAVGGVLVWHPWQSTNQASSVSAIHPKIIINEAARTLLYLPLYHAQRAGYFAQEGVDVEIITGGSATNAVAAIISGNADIAQADPMYAPISQSKGADVVVIGQIVGRIGLWALERPGNNLPFDRIGLNGATIITHPKPMTSHTYAEIALRDNGLKESDATFIEAKPGTEVATYAAERRAQFIVTVEPVVSILQTQGARIVHSWPDALGDRVFSGLMVRQATLKAKPDALRRILRAYQHALNDIAAKNPNVNETARSYFPNLAPAVLDAALHRLVDENVFPKSLQISEASWANAVHARREAGELTGPAAYDSNVEHSFILQSAH